MSEGRQEIEDRVDELIGGKVEEQEGEERPFKLAIEITGQRSTEGLMEDIRVKVDGRPVEFSREDESVWPILETNSEGLFLNYVFF